MSERVISDRKKVVISFTSKFMLLICPARVKSYSRANSKLASILQTIVTV